MHAHGLVLQAQTMDLASSANQKDREGNKRAHNVMHAHQPRASQQSNLFSPQIINSKSFNAPAHMQDFNNRPKMHAQT
jgi:hypothetical protein